MNDTPLSFSRFAAVALTRLAALFMFGDYFLKAADSATPSTDRSAESWFDKMNPKFTFFA